MDSESQNWAVLCFGVQMPLRRVCNWYVSCAFCGFIYLINPSHVPGVVLISGHMNTYNSPWRGERHIQSHDFSVCNSTIETCTRAGRTQRSERETSWAGSFQPSRAWRADIWADSLFHRQFPMNPAVVPFWVHKPWCSYRQISWDRELPVNNVLPAQLPVDIFRERQRAAL